MLRLNETLSLPLTENTGMMDLFTKALFRKILVISCVFSSFTMAACGALVNPFTDLSSDIVEDEENFTGIYHPRSNSCLSATFGEFEILQSGPNLTLLIREPLDNVQLVSGDRFAGTQTIKIDPTTASAMTAFDVVSWGCAGIIINTESQLNDFKKFTSIEMQMGDLILSCTDSSADGLCEMAYARKMTP